MDEALCYEQALEPCVPISRKHGGIVLISGSTRGDFERGWPEYEWRLKCAEPLIVDRR